MRHREALKFYRILYTWASCPVASPSYQAASKAQRLGYLFSELLGARTCISQGFKLCTGGVPL